MQRHGTTFSSLETLYLSALICAEPPHPPGCLSLLPGRCSSRGGSKEAVPAGCGLWGWAEGWCCGRFHVTECGKHLSNPRLPQMLIPHCCSGGSEFAARDVGATKLCPGRSRGSARPLRSLVTCGHCGTLPVAAGPRVTAVAVAAVAGAAVQQWFPAQQRGREGARFGPEQRPGQGKGLQRASDPQDQAGAVCYGD